MTSSNNRPLFTRMLALALAALACGFTTGGHAAQPAQGGGAQADKVSAELRGFVARAKADTVGVIVQLNAPPSGRLNALLQRNGVRVRGRFASLDAMAVELPAAALAELAGFAEVEWVTRDREVANAGHVTATTGADAVRTLPALMGDGILMSDSTVGSQSVLVSGDGTACMK